MLGWIRGVGKRKNAGRRGHGDGVPQHGTISVGVGANSRLSASGRPVLVEVLVVVVHLCFCAKWALEMGWSLEVWPP